MKENVCIIGGGIIGLMTAYSLFPYYNIIILEKENKLCSQASYHNANTLFYSRILPLKTKNVSYTTIIKDLNFFDYKVLRWGLWNLVYNYIPPSSHQDNKIYKSIKTDSYNIFKKIIKDEKVNIDLIES